MNKETGIDLEKAWNSDTVSDIIGDSQGWRQGYITIAHVRTHGNGNYDGLAT